MARLRQNFQSGVTTNNPLAIGDTALASGNLAALTAVTGSDYLAVTLDPAGTNGAPEIVHVTAHTALATSATITRAQEGSTARAHPMGTVWEHNITEDDFDYANLANLPAATTANFVRNNRASTDIVLNSTTWANVDTALDIVLPAIVGTWVEVGLSCALGTSAVAVSFDAVSLVAGSPVNSLGEAAAPNNSYDGVSGWHCANTAANIKASGSIIYQAVSGDLSGGNITLRLRYRTGAASNRTLIAHAGFPLTFWARTN